MKKIPSVIFLLIVIVVLYFWFHKPTPRYSNEKEQQFYKTIDSLSKEIEKDKRQIESLDSAKRSLQDQINKDKQELADASKQAEEYKKQYEKERDRINNMSNADVVSQFSKTFK